MVLPLALMRCSIASRWLSQTASSSLCQRVAAMAQEADVALYRVQERALRPKRWKLTTEANAQGSTALRNRFAAMLERLPPFADESAARSDVVKSARNALQRSLGVAGVLSECSGRIGSLSAGGSRAAPRTGQQCTHNKKLTPQTPKQQRPQPRTSRTSAPPTARPAARSASNP